MAKYLLPEGGFRDGIKYRFRTLVDRAIGMGGVSAGESFVSEGPKWSVSFDDPALPNYYSCCRPQRSIERGDIEWIPDEHVRLPNEED